MMKKEIEKLLSEYLEAPEAWGDNIMVEVNPESKELRLVDDEVMDIDNSPLDYWPVMDLLKMSVENPGAWVIDPEAVAEFLDTYR